MKKSVDSGAGVRIFGSILLIILCCVLIGSVIKIVFGGSEFTFAGFLNYITSVPQIRLSDVNIFYISGEWAILDGLRRFINSIMSIANFGVWFTTQLLNGLSYIFYFVRFLFVV